MLDFMFNTVWGWIGTAGVIVIACLVVGYFIPSFRLAALGIAGVAISVATLYTKATRDERARQQRMKDEAVAKARKAYDKIDARPDTPDAVARRLRDHGF